MKLSIAKTSLYASLNLRKNRRNEGLFLISGHKCVEDMASAFNVKAIVCADGYTLPAILKDKAEVFTASPSSMSRISKMDSPPDVIAVCEIPAWTPDSSVISSSLSLMLDDIQDPGNLGTIIRAADWFGVRNIFASHGTADVFSSKAVQATMGALSRVKVYYADLEDVIRQFPDMHVYGTLLDGDNIYNATLSKTGLIIMGNEGRGISPKLREYVTNRLLIPSFPPNEPNSESLNVGVATAITLSEFRRRLTIK